MAYQKTGLRFLGGLQGRKELLKVWSDEQFQDYPLVSGSAPHYWGRGCQVTFKHEGRTVTHKGLVVLAGPLRDQWRQNRRKQLQILEAEMAQVRADIGQPRLRSLKAVQRRVNSKLKKSKAGKFMQVDVYEAPCSEVNLCWRLDSEALAEQERLDGRYLLVSNDWTLSHQQMFQLYRDKDGGEKRFLIGKQDLKVSPIYLHKDQRIAAMLLLNMLALLAYSLLERQMRQQGLQLTTRQLIRKLEQLALIETHCHDGSRLYRLTDTSPECQRILLLVSVALNELVQEKLSSQLLQLIHPQLPLRC